MNRVALVFISILLASTINAQIEERKDVLEVNRQSDYAPPLKKMIDLKDIWKNYTFSSETVRGVRSMNDGKNYTVLERGKSGVNLVKYNYNTGKKCDEKGCKIND